MAKDKSIGISNKDNLAGWADYAKGNNYQCDKQALKHNLGTEGANADYRESDVKDWKQPQRKFRRSRLGEGEGHYVRQYLHRPRQQ